MKICDFGISRMYKSKAATMTQGCMGTPVYMPPECMSDVPPTKARRHGTPCKHTACPLLPAARDPPH